MNDVLGLLLASTAVVLTVIGITSVTGKRMYRRGYKSALGDVTDVAVGRRRLKSEITRETFHFSKRTCEIAHELGIEQE